MGGNPAPGQPAPNPIMSFLPFIVIILIIYFMMIRPQKKRQQEREKLISGVQKGDKIVTVGGLHGTVQSTKEKTVIVKIADNVKVEIERVAIASVLTGGKDETPEVLPVEEKK
ncbi:preprotein translocase subunit YajC [bacterium]|nr:preprotein translocase subunit YajC [bacterium]